MRPYVQSDDGHRRIEMAEAGARGALTFIVLAVITAIVGLVVLGVLAWLFVYGGE